MSTRSGQGSTAVPTSRAQRVVQEHDYGDLLSSHRVNRAQDRQLATAVLLLPIVAVVFLWMAWQASPWGDLGGSLVAMVPSSVAGLVFLVLALILCPPVLVGLVRGQRAWVHVHTQGVIAERLGGKLYAWQPTRATVQLVRWQQAWEGHWRDREQLWVTFRDGERICFDGRDARDRAALSDLARALGAGDEPTDIGQLHSAKAPVPF